MGRRVSSIGWVGVLLVLFAFGASARADGDNAARQRAQNDADVKAALRDFHEADARARALYERQRAAAQQVATRRLQAKEARAKKAGELDLAAAIRTLIDSLKPGALDAPGAAAADASPPVGAAGAAGPAGPAGPWMEPNGNRYILMPDGTFTDPGGSPGHWVVEGTKVVARLDDGIRLITFNDCTADKMVGRAQDERQVTLLRIPLVPPDANGHPLLAPAVLAGVWVDDRGKRLVLAVDGLFLYDNRDAGYWQVRADSLQLHFNNGRLDTYGQVSGNRLSGTSTDANKHQVMIAKLPGR